MKSMKKKARNIYFVRSYCGCPRVAGGCHGVLALKGNVAESKLSREQSKEWNVIMLRNNGYLLPN